MYNMENKIISFNQGSFEYEELQIQETLRKDNSTEIEVIFTNTENNNETYDQEITVRIIRFQDKLIIGKFKTIFRIKTVGKLHLKLFRDEMDAYIYMTSFALSQSRGAFKVLCDKVGLDIDIKKIPVQKIEEIRENILSGYFSWNN